MRTLSLLVVVSHAIPAFAQPPVASPGNRLAYLDDLDPYYPHGKFPKLTTPQWVGEPDVDAVVVLAIDDMRDPKKYETFLRPILNRLKKIDGRAPVCIMSCNVDPNDKQIQSWLKEGLSIEVHTVDHPCPFFKPGFAKAKDTTDRCVDLMHTIPGNRPVAFRMPCCDSLNTPSPRHWAEIFNKPTNKSNYLTLDSSVFTVFTSADPELPKELVLEEGKERFKKYLPMDREFVNWIENYPYPYLIGKYCWQFPCMTPSDWEAQYLQKANSPLTVRDWKAALDCTVAKKGVFNMVFHPHGWIKAEQVIDFIDHAVEKHGKKVKFLTFKEAHARLQKSLFRGDEWRSAADSVFILDVNNDGYLDIVDLRSKAGKTYLWDPEYSHWRVVQGPDGLALHIILGATLRFGVLQKNGYASMAYQYGHIGEITQGVYHFDGKEWIDDKNQRRTFSERLALKFPPPLRLLDIDGDGICEMISKVGSTFLHKPGKVWQPLPFDAPLKAGARFVDLNGDGKLDLVNSDESSYAVHVFGDMKTGWKQIRAGKPGDPSAIPMIARSGANNGCFVHSGHLWWANEDTVLLKNHVDRRSFKELLAGK
jgi:peptidoglycan/xylan/chitin deacetylase (PgdA/CDA1 family)